MFEKLEVALKLVCLALAALLLSQILRFALARDPLGGVKIPRLPSLAAATNAPPSGEARPEAPAPSGRTSPTNAPEAGGAKKTNNVAGRVAPRPMRGMPSHSGVGTPSALPAEAQARVDQIVQSEILGPVIHPVPMGLLGIAGDSAMLRATNGQTGLVKAGGEMGGIKVLRIGTNRVLVETDGQKQELTLFNGLGGESLLPKTKETQP